MLKDKIVVIGGYGQVGQMICNDLAHFYPGKVFAAGRSQERAEAFSRATQGRVEPLRIDADAGADPVLLSEVKLVIMCLDQQNSAFVQACIGQGIHYIDLSADYRLLSQVELMHPLAVTHGATVILSVGLAPGMSNLLSLHAKQHLDVTEAIYISLMLGLGDSHGKAAIEWTVDNLRSNFTTMEQGKVIQHTSFADGRKTDFGNGQGSRTAYRFNFADQHILPRTLQVPSISTRLCFDSPFITGLLSRFKRLGGLKLLNIPWIRDAAVKAFASMRIGKPTFALKVDAVGKKQDQPALVECFLQGVHEAEVTAKAAAIVARKLYTSHMPHGVFHIEQLFTIDSFDEELKEMAHMSSRLRIGTSPGSDQTTETSS